MNSPALNPVDWKLRSGEMKIMSGNKFPKGIGCDFAGVVEKVGENVEGLQKSDEVFGWLGYKQAGTFAEYVIVKSEQVVKKPSNISFQEASCLPMVGATALIALKKGELSAGKEVLINGCTGGVGHIACQIAKASGAKVTGTCSTKNIESAQKLGIDRIVDYKKENIYELGKKFDVVFDTPGKLDYKKTKTLLKSNGKFLDLNPGGILDILHGSFSSTYKVIMASVKKNHLVELARLGKEGKLKPIISKEFSLENAINEIENVEKGNSNAGKVVCVVK